MKKKIKKKTFKKNKENKKIIQKRKKKNNSLIKKILIFLGSGLVISLFLTVFLTGELKERGKNLISDKIGKNDLNDFEEVNLLIDWGVVFLRGKENPCWILPIYISLDQSYAILEGLKKTGKRPLIHDLFKEVLDIWQIDLLGIKITSLKEGVYYAELILKKGDSLLKLDSRPSDAFALGVRKESPIYVKKDLLFNQGKNLCGEKEKEKKENKKKNLLKKSENQKEKQIKDKKKKLGLWSSSYDVSFTSRRSPVQIRPGPSENLEKNKFNLMRGWRSGQTRYLEGVVA